MNIVVVGTGYVGLVTGVGFANLKHEVTFIDLDSKKIKLLNEKKLPFFEPDLDKHFENSENFERMNFLTNYEDVEWDIVDIVFICVQTPNNVSTNSVDTKFLESAIGEIASLNRDDIVITVKSTIPPYEIENVCKKIGFNKEKLTFNPEFLREGSAVYDFFNPDRIVIGGYDQSKINILLELYSDFNCEIIVTDSVSSQLIKYLANTYLPLRLTFVNEASRLVNYSNANLEDVLKGVGMDKRIGKQYFRPSPSWGGSCFPKDLVEVNNFYDNKKLELPLISNIIKSNNIHLHWTINQMMSLKESNDLKNIVLVGAAFKENTDDLRNSPTLDAYKILNEDDIKVLIYDSSLSVENHACINSVEDIPNNSLIAIMYPLTENEENKLKEKSQISNSVMYYPWK
ncbi:MAG: nucleotide sugar dehydrogenase [Pelagibacteraceae bacterium]